MVTVITRNTSWLHPVADRRIRVDLSRTLDSVFVEAGISTSGHGRYYLNGMAVDDNNGLQKTFEEHGIKDDSICYLVYAIKMAAI